MVDEWVDDEYDYGDDYCYECGGYGDDYFENENGELESYCPYCNRNPANNDWDY